MSLQSGSYSLHFEVLRVLGGGGAGTVYLVRHRVTEELSALKVIHINDRGSFSKVRRGIVEGRATASYVAVDDLKLVGRSKTVGRLDITATTALLIYGRSAANVRDHRHVTSLLQPTRCTENGVEVCPQTTCGVRMRR